LKETKDFQAGLVSGLFDADGWFVKDRKTFAIELTSSEDINKLQLILNRLGVDSRVRKVRNSSTRVFPENVKRNVSSLYRLTINGYSMASRFVEVCNPKHNKKLNLFNGVEEPKYTRKEHTFKVSDIKRVGIEPVYDMCVP
jgi:hypothetical protein